MLFSGDEEHFCRPVFFCARALSVSQQTSSCAFHDAARQQLGCRVSRLLRTLHPLCSLCRCFMAQNRFLPAGTAATTKGDLPCSMTKDRSISRSAKALHAIVFSTSSVGHCLSLPPDYICLWENVNFSCLQICRFRKGYSFLTRNGADARARIHGTDEHARNG
jgi:hypothetical protein